jgi:hypothetical protein
VKNKVKGERNSKKWLKYEIAHELCEPNLEWNFDISQNRVIIKSEKWSEMRKEF